MAKGERAGERRGACPRRTAGNGLVQMKGAEEKLAVDMKKPDGYAGSRLAQKEATEKNVPQIWNISYPVRSIGSRLAQ